MSRSFLFTSGLLLLVLLIMSSSFAESKAEGTRGYKDERYKPAPVYNGPTRTGKQVYVYRCATCHDRTTQGAPLPDDDVEWGRRIQKGKDVLLKHVVEGYKELMPVKGGCRNCTEGELVAAIDYMLQTSGVEKAPNKK